MLVCLEADDDIFEERGIENAPVFCCPLKPTFFSLLVRTSYSVNFVCLSFGART